jgi:hypothetical protein
MNGRMCSVIKSPLVDSAILLHLIILRLRMTTWLPHTISHLTQSTIPWFMIIEGLIKQILDSRILWSRDLAYPMLNLNKYWPTYSATVCLYTNLPPIGTAYWRSAITCRTRDARRPCWAENLRLKSSSDQVRHRIIWMRLPIKSKDNIDDAANVSNLVRPTLRAVYAQFICARAHYIA